MATTAEKLHSFNPGTSLYVHRTASVNMGVRGTDPTSPVEIVTDPQAIIALTRARLHRLTSVVFDLTPGLTAADSAVEHGKNRDLTYTVRGGTPAQDINEGHQLTDFTDSLLELYWDQTAENFRPEVTEANRAADLRAHYLGNTAASAILVHQAA